MMKEKMCFCKLVLWAAFVAACGLAVLFLGEAVADDKPTVINAYLWPNTFTIDK